MRLVIGIALLACISSARDWNWQRGNIVNADSIRDQRNAGAVIPLYRTQTNVVLRGGHYEFVAESHQGCRLPVGDDVQYAVERGKLHIIDADGNECKLRIFHQVSLQLVMQPQATEQSNKPVSSELQ